MSELNDTELHELLSRDSRAGWRAFIDRFTPLLLASIEQSGVRSHDEVMEVYVRVCEHLAAGDCSRLRRHDPGKGVLAGWLRTVVRNAVVDWVRVRKGRNRLFKTIQALSALDRRVFEAFYWRGLRPVEIASMPDGEPPRAIGLGLVFEALERIERALTARQRVELLATTTRTTTPVPLEDEHGDPVVDVADERWRPDTAFDQEHGRAELVRALGQLPLEDSLIISMRYLDGLTLLQVKRALGIDALSEDRVTTILARLRTCLER